MIKNRENFYLVLLAILLIYLFFIFRIENKQEEPEIENSEFRTEIEVIVSTPTPTPVSTSEPTFNPVIEEYRKLIRKIDGVPLLCTKLVLGDSYNVFLTAYCAEECGWNYETSSGEICHRSSEINRYEPSTAAIDLRYFRYGDLFYIPSEDRVYIAEDTGAFRGMWIDLYQDDMQDVQNYNTRYETVFMVEIEYYFVPASKFDVRRFLIKEKNE